MNLNDGEEEDDLFFNQYCLELAKLLRTEQTEDFLRLYDSLPSEWTDLRLETAKESIRQLQELDEDKFKLLYQSAFQDDQYHQFIIMSNLPKQHNERIIENNFVCNEEYDLTSKLKRNNDEMNTKTRRLQSITNNSSTHDIVQNTCRTYIPVDSFANFNLTPVIDIRVEDYKKAKDTIPTSKTSSTNNRSFNLQSIDTNESNQMKKKENLTTIDRSHEDATFHYFPNALHDDIEQSSRSSSSSSSSTTTNQKNNQILSQSNSCKHSKLIENHDFDSHGSSIATKSSSENSGSIRTGSGSDSDDGEKKPLLSQSVKTKSQNHNDDTLTVVLSQTSDNRTSQHNNISSLPEQDSYELVNRNTPNDPLSRPQLPRKKQSAIDDSNGIHYSNNDITTTQRSLQNNLSSSSQQTRNSELHEQYNTNHSNSSCKSGTRRAKKRKQLQQQEIIRTELIPGHRGDRDVDELVMFIDGNSSIKQRQNSSSNSNSTSRRKSRKSSKILQDNENKIDDNAQSIHFIDDDQTTTTTTNTHSLNEQTISPNNQSHSNTTNGEISLSDWNNTSLTTNDDLDSLSLSSITLNNSNSEIISEPFVTVTHRRRSLKERRQDNNNNNNSTNLNNSISSRTSRFPDKRRFQPVQNEIIRPTISNTKPSISTTTKEETTTIVSLPSFPTSSIPEVKSTSEEISPRLSSHSSSSSLSSIVKRQSKVPPPVVFLNKSIDIELNDVSFGFDMENSITDKQPSNPPTPTPISSTEPLIEKEQNIPSSNRRSYSQRNSRGAGFYSGSDIRPHQQRNYSSQSSSSYIDPLLLLQYNQQRYQQLAYMNYLRTQYLPTQQPYIFIPTSSNSFSSDDKTDISEQIQEPLFVYTTIPNQTQPMYYSGNKKSFPTVYPSQYFYPQHSAYFQPITPLVNEDKSQQNDDDNDDYEKSTKTFQQTRQQSSSNIMSNALQLVYSQEKLNAQTDRFNLDQLTAYLAMKWTDAIDHYEQGDDEILLIDEQ